MIRPPAQLARTTEVAPAPWIMRDPDAAAVPADPAALRRLLLGGVVIGLLILGSLRIDTYLHARAIAHLRYTLAIEPAAPRSSAEAGQDARSWTVRAVLENQGPASAASLQLHLALAARDLVDVTTPTIVASDAATTIRPRDPLVNAFARQQSSTDLAYDITTVVPHAQLTITLPCTVHGVTATTVRARYQAAQAAGQLTAALATVCLAQLSVTGDHVTLTRSDGQPTLKEQALTIP